MLDFGREPLWRSRTAGDRLLVALFTTIHAVLFAPFLLLDLLLRPLKVEWALLDLLSAPGSLLKTLLGFLGPKARAWGLKYNALAHLFLVCRLCPRGRYTLRDPEAGGRCLWNEAWNAGHFEIVPDFGPGNWATQYVGRTDLAAYESLRPLGLQGPARTTAARVLWRFLASTALLALLAVLLPRALGCDTRLATPAWETLAAVPGAEERFPPQGLKRYGSGFLFSNHHKDRLSRVYQLDAALKATRSFAMPPEARHTSGLAVRGNDLFAVDYRSLKLYRIDIEASLASGRAVLLDQVATGISNLSAVCLATHGGREYLVLSQHALFATLFVVDPAKAFAGPFEAAVVQRVKGNAWSQGLAFDAGRLYDGVNALGRDRIVVMDFEALLRTGKATAATREVIRFEGRMIEDLLVEGGDIYSSDEETFRFYRTARRP